MKSYLFELAAAAASLLAEGYIWGELSLTSALAVHGILSALNFLLLIPLKKLHADLRFSAARALFILFFGPIGAAVSLASLAIYPLLKARASKKDLLSVLLPEEEKIEAEELYERMLYGMEYSDPENVPLAFEDIIAFGSEEQKRMAIEKMLKHFRPEFASSLLHALNDPNNSIRVLAATAVARIDKQYWDRSAELEEQVKRFSGSSASLLKFALFSRQYAKLKILDSERAEKVRANAIFAFREYCKIKPGSEHAEEELAKLLMQNGDFEEAKEILDHLVLEKEELKDELLELYLSCLFKMGNFAAIRQTAEKSLRITGESVRYDDLIETLMLWKRGAPEYA